MVLGYFSTNEGDKDRRGPENKEQRRKKKNGHILYNVQSSEPTIMI